MTINLFFVSYKSQDINATGFAILISGYEDECREKVKTICNTFDTSKEGLELLAEVGSVPSSNSKMWIRIRPLRIRCTLFPL